MTNDPLSDEVVQGNEKRVYLHALPVRVWHWVNALGFTLLILTGIQIRYAELFHVMTFEAAIKWHNWIGFVVVGNSFIWLLYYLFSRKITNYHPIMKAKPFFRGFFHQVGYYAYGMFRGQKKPHQVVPNHKFNPMQRLTYQVVMMITAPLQVITGILLWDVNRFQWLIELVGGIRVVSTIHIAMFIAFAFFIPMHAYMGALGKKPSTHYKEMITGYEED